MANIALQRLQREFKEVITSKEVADTGIVLEMKEDGDFTKLRGSVRGPPDTPYHGGTFDLDIKVLDTYPFHPPQIKFVTKLWHPNVSSQTGTICLDVLKDQWAASMTLRTVLLSIQALLCAPEPNDPQDAVVAKQFLNNSLLYKETARYWAQLYANAPGTLNKEFTDKVKHLKDMGVTQDKAVSSLSCNSWDLSKATDYIFS